MKRIYLLTVLILCVSTVQAQEEIQETPKLKKNTVYINIIGIKTFDDDVHYYGENEPLFDFSYARNFTKTIKGEIGAKLWERPIYYIGVGFDVNLFKGLYLVPRVDLGYTKIPDIQIEHIAICFYNDYQKGGWSFLLQGGLNFEYRFNSSWRAVVGADYNYIFKDDGAYPKNSLTLKLGAGFSF